MSLSENPQQTQFKPRDPSPLAPHPFTPPSASATVAAKSKLERSIQQACKTLRRIFYPEDDDGEIQKNLGVAWVKVYGALSEAGDSNQKERLRNESEFNAYVRHGSNGERELIKLLRSMAKQEVPWRDLFDSGTLLSSL